MSIASKLTAVLNLDSAQFERGTKKANKSFSSFSKEVSKQAKRAALAIAGAGAAMAALGVRSAKVIDQTTKTANKLGILTSELQALRLVADEAGLASTTFDMALQRMTRRVAEAAQGTGEAQNALKELGIEATSLARLSPDKQFEKIATTLEGVESSSDRVRLAFKLFDSEGVNVVNMLGDMSGELQRAREFNEKFNVSLTDIDAAKVEEANDAFGRIGKAISGLGNTIAVQFAPIVTEISERLLGAGVDGEHFGKAVKGGIKAAVLAVDILRRAINGVSILFNSVIFTIQDLTAKVSLRLFNLGDNIASAFNKFSKITGIVLEAEDALLNFALSSKIAANETQKSLQKSIDEAQNFKSLAGEIDDIEARATERAKQRSAAEREKAGAISLVNLKTEDGAESQKKLSKEINKTSKEMDDFGDASGQAFDGFISDMQRGVSAIDSLRNFAINTLSDILRTIGGTGGGGGLGSAIGESILGAFGTIGTSSFDPATTAPPPKPSFATGIKSVPRDMDARIHKGEAIIPASQAKKLGPAGGSTYNIDARGADAGVLPKIENLMREMTQLRRDVPTIAVSSVKDANQRNPRLLTV